MSMGLAWLWAACLLMLRAVFLLFWRISMVCLAVELVGSWVELGFSVGTEVFAELLSVTLPWIQEFSDVLRSWSYASCLWLSVLFLQ